MKDVTTPVLSEEVRQIMRRCLEEAALINYTRMSDCAGISGMQLIFVNCHFIIFSYFFFWKLLHFLYYFDVEARQQK